MTDRTHPDSGRITGGIVEMLQARAAPQPATTITVEQVEDYIGLQSGAWDTIGAEKIVEAVLRLANIAPHRAPQAVRESQPMPDLTQLTERGAAAWAGVDAQGLREGFTAADMATAEARGFRDGVASLAASAGSEPVAVVGSDFTLYWAGTGPIAPIVEKHGIKVGSPLYSHPSPPEGMVGGWMPIETAPVAGLILLAVEDSAGERRVFPAEASHENGGWVWQVTLGWLGWTRLHSGWRPILWRRLPPPPTSFADSRKGG